MNRSEVPAIVVGAGPAGLAAAITLAGLGVETLVVERRRERSAHPRATVISTRSMELIRAWGIEQEVLAGAVDVEWLMWSCRTLAEAGAGTAIPVGLPSRSQSALISPVAPACVPQDFLEPVLLDRVLALGGRVELGTELTAIESRADGARVTLGDAASGAVRSVGARFVIAADGARSAVRRHVGIAMHGSERLGQAVNALFHAPLWPVLGDRRFGIYDITHPDAGGVFLPAGRGDRWLYGLNWPYGEHDPAEFTRERMLRRIQAGAGVAGLEPRIERLGTFTFAAQLAERFSHEHIFLVGDAAHRVTPRGGTGMNTAIHDGFDLGWKLGWVLRGWAPEGLLESYEAERRPVAEHNVARSADPGGTVRTPDGELLADLGGRLKHAWVPAPAARASTLDLLGPGLTLFAGEGSDVHVPEGPTPVTVRRVDSITARALGIRPGGGLLVRPDGTQADSARHAVAA